MGETIREYTTDEVRRILEARCNGKWDEELDGLLAWIGAFRKDREGLTRSIKKQELDFTTVMEIANQINAKSLDSHGMESYIGYIVSTTRGKFAVSKVFLLRQSELESSRIVLNPPRPGQPGFEFDAKGSFGQRVCQTARPFFLRQLDAKEWDFPEIEFLRANEVELCVPLIRRDDQAGVDLKGLLALGRRIVKLPYSESELNFMGLLADMIAISFHNAQLHRRSIVDALTQVYSRGHFDMHLVMEVARADRYTRQQPGDEIRVVSLILADIDHFKKINDNYGHPVGDAALRAIAAALKDGIRKSDVIARYGGEEFALVAPETKKEEGYNLAERLRKKIGSLTIDTPKGPISVSASFGVAAYPGDARDTRSLVAAADRALYRAKEAGRNRVVQA